MMHQSMTALVLTKLFVWAVPLHFFNVYQHQVEAYNLLDKPGFFKFIVAIKSKAGVCTGTIINKDWVLTAAHCLHYDGDVLANEDVTVMAGITNYEYPQPDTGQFRTSEEIHVHPRFVYDKLAKFDITLVRVNDSFKFNDWVESIEIAGDGWPIYEEVENNCMSLGFGGYRGDTSPVNYLKVWNITAAHGGGRCPCSRRFQYKRLVCAKNADYAKLCQGDDGGPLVCGNVVRGIAHMVRNWYECSEDPKYPLENCVGSPDRGLSIYMLLCPFNDWMHGVVPDIPPSPSTCTGSFISYSITAVVLSLILFYFTM